LDAPGIREIWLGMEGPGRDKTAGVRRKLPVGQQNWAEYQEMREGVT